MVAPLTGFFQSLVPVASPTKLSTVIGALSGKSVQLKSPAVVWMRACIGCLGAAGVVGFAVLDVAGFAVAGLVAVCAAANAVSERAAININDLFMMASG